MTSSYFRSSTAAPGLGAPLPAPVALCPGHVPLVLLPIRLETRFFPAAGGDAELRVRIFPDKVHADSHEPALTAAERESAARYWELDWRAGPDRAGRLAAWRLLANRFTASRAAWILRVTTPVNAAQRPLQAVPAAQTLSPMPALPPLGPSGLAVSAWSRAPRAQLLPDRWVAVVHVNGQPPLTMTGRDVPRPLPIGPDPAFQPADGGVPATDQLALDPGMRWMVDFDAAEACGMALRIALPAAALTAGLDSLFVYGVAASLQPADAATALADLLDAQQYTDGLAFLPLGTPTNNTDEQRAGETSDDEEHAESFERVVLGDPSRASNALSLGRLLGLARGRTVESLGRVAGAASDHERDARSMNTALWPVGWGYFLANLIGAGAGLSMPLQDWLRAHHRDFVRAGGPLPPLRIGAQPYGVLPVTSLDSWVASAGDTDASHQQQLRDFLLTLREQVWRPVAGEVPRVGLRHTPTDPDADLADVMRMDGVSHRPVLRSVIGRHVLEHLTVLSGGDFEATAQQQRVLAARLLQRLNLPAGLASTAGVMQLFFSPASRKTEAPLVQAGGDVRGERLQSDYIQALLEAPDVQALVEARPEAGTSLLQALLRHALLREHAIAAARLVATLPGQDLHTLLRDAQLVDMVDPPVVNFSLGQPLQTLHWRRQLDMRVAGITGEASVRDYLASHVGDARPELSGLRECREALAHLRTLDSAQLAVLLQSTVDLTSHRLDAWITSLATRRLSAMTAPGEGQGAGLMVGGYGWVENLRPADGATVVPEAAWPAGEPGPLRRPAADSGFIHAPSFTHATAAALLRNAHLGPSGQPSADDPFAIDLSSRRARDAAELLDGIRHGQPLGALLGYRLERRLHDLHLDQFIDPLRRASPLTPRRDETGAAADAALAPGRVVDALTLLQRRKEPGDTLLEQALQAATAEQKQQVMRELDALDRAVDGVSDALTAESAYQLARGNTTRLASTLAAVAQGDMPPELEVLRTPRSGVSATHRVLMLMAGGPQTGNGWASSASSPLAGSERMLNAWASRLIGDARKIRCTVDHVDPGSGRVLSTAVFPLSELSLTPLDFVHGADADAGTMAGSEALCTVEQWVLYGARRRPGGLPEPAVLRLRQARPADLGAGELTLHDALGQARAVRAALEVSRCVRPEDLAQSDRQVQAVMDLAELEGRVVRGEQLLATAHRTLAGLLAGGASTTAESLRTALMTLSAFGLTASVPVTAVSDSAEIRAGLARQAAASLAQAQARLDRGAALRAQPPSMQERARCDQLLARGQAVFGERFLLLPLFTLAAADASEVKSALAASTPLQAGDALQAHEWFARSARVREPMARLAECLAGAEALGAGDRLNLSVLQLPFTAADRWVALRPLNGTALAAGRLSLVVQSASGLNPTLPLCGLLFDEWVEVIPQQEETTAIAFQFDPPDHCAPQSILVAVPPVTEQDWTTETLRRVLAETLDLAKLRAVDPALLGDFAQLLPALLLPFNAVDDAVSTDLSPLAG